MLEIEFPQQLIDELIHDEGLVLETYPDTEGILTIGVGHNLEAHKQTDIKNCTKDQAIEWLKQDMQTSAQWLKSALPWVYSLDIPRLSAMQNMAFNMEARLLGFRRALGLLRVGAFKESGAEFRNSLWAIQVGQRAVRLTKRIETGIWVPLEEHHAKAASV